MERMKKIVIAALSAVLLAALPAALSGGCVTAGHQPSASGFYRIQSPMIYSVRYDAAEQVMTVVFRSGEVLDYQKVTQDVFDLFLASDSQDDFFHRQIEGKLPSVKVAL